MHTPTHAPEADAHGAPGAGVEAGAGLGDVEEGAADVHGVGALRHHDGVRLLGLCHVKGLMNRVRGEVSTVLFVKKKQLRKSEKKAKPKHARAARRAS